MLGVSVMLFFLLFIVFSGSRSISNLQSINSELKAELEQSIRITTNLRAENQELIRRELDFAKSLERANQRNTEMESRLRESAIDIERAGREVNDLGELLLEIIRIVEGIFPGN